jgi:hypothetical protein
MRKGIMALEGMDEMQEEAAVAPEASDFVEAPENDMLEMNEASVEMDDVNDGIEEAAETVDTLDEMHEALSESAEEGGMSEPEARAVTAAVEHLVSRLGFPRTRKLMPATENFADKTGRVQATKLAMEAIKEVAGKVWAAIVRAFDQAIAWVVKFWNSLFDGAQKLEKRAEALQKSADGKKGSEVKKDTKIKSGGTLGVGGLLSTLNVGGAMPEGSAFVTKYKEFAKSTSQDSAAKAQSDAKKLSDAVAEMVGAIADKPAFDRHANDAIAAVKSMAGGNVSANKDMGGEGVVVMEEPQVFGQISKYTVVPKEAANFGSAKLMMSASTGAKDLAASSDIAALSPAEVHDIAGIAKQHMAGYQAFRDFSKKINEFQKKTQATCKEAGSKFGTFEKSDAKVNASIAGNAARSLIALTSSGLSATRKYDITVTKAALDYCASSLKAHGEGKGGTFTETKGLGNNKAAKAIAA